MISERAKARTILFLFSIKFKLVRELEEFALRAWEREVAPLSPIKFLLKSKLVKEEFAVRAWEW